VQFLKYDNLNGKDCLITGYANGAQIHNVDGSRMLNLIKCPPGFSEDNPIVFTGACSVKNEKGKNFLALISQKALLCLVDKEGDLEVAWELDTKLPMTDCCFDEASGVLAIGDCKGNLHFLKPETHEKATLIKTVKHEKSVSVVSLSTMNRGSAMTNVIVAGF